MALDVNGLYLLGFRCHHIWAGIAAKDNTTQKSHPERQQSRQRPAGTHAVAQNQNPDQSRHCDLHDPECRGR